MMRRTRLRSPYTPTGRTAFPLRDLPGVYLIYQASSLVYVGYSGSDVYKALYRHFEEWNDRFSTRGPRITYDRDACKVRVIYCNRPEQAAELERALILTRRPADNPDKLELYEVTDEGRDLANDALSSDLLPVDEVPF